MTSQVKLEPYFFKPLNTDGTFAPFTGQRYGLPQPEIELPPPPPTFSEEEVKAAEQRGSQQGYLRGLEDGHARAQSEHAQVDRELTELVTRLAEQITGVLKQYHEFLARQQQELPKLALAIARKVAGEALENDPSAVIEQMVMRSLGVITGEPRMLITVHSSVAEALEARLLRAFEGNEDAGEVIIASEDTMERSDCRIEWQQGSAERSASELWYEVESVLASVSREVQSD